MSGPPLDPELEAILVRATAAEPADRYQTALEMQQAIDAYRGRIAKFCTPREVAEVIKRASKYVPVKHLFPCTNCGMAPMDRDIAIKKLEALVAGTALARKQLRKKR